MKNILIFLSFALFSCGNDDLSHSEAKAQILQSYDFPKVETNRLIVLDRTTGIQNTVNKMNKFQQKGLLTYYIKQPQISSGFGRVSVGGNSRAAIAELTNKGRKYVVSEKKGDYLLSYYIVKVSELNFGEITSIKIYKEFNIAEVTYTLKRKITPFGNGMSNTIGKMAKFAKYDDGWRMENY